LSIVLNVFLLGSIIKHFKFTSFDELPKMSKIFNRRTCRYVASYHIHSFYIINRWISVHNSFDDIFTFHGKFGTKYSLISVKFLVPGLNFVFLDCIGYIPDGFFILSQRLESALIHMIYINDRSESNIGADVV